MPISAGSASLDVLPDRPLPSALQAADALDGKQARATGTSSPLGELVDHGCDALGTTLELLSLGAAVQAGAVGSPAAGGAWAGAGGRLVWMWAVGVTIFYMATWETLHTGRLYLGIVNVPNEGLLLCAACYAVTAARPLLWTERLRHPAL